MSDDHNGHDGLAEGPEQDTPMTFLEHVGELRKRLVRAAIAIFIGFIASFAFAKHIAWFLKWPLVKGWTEAGRDGEPVLQAIQIQDSLMVDVRVALAAGIALALPVISYQLWMFIAPGLYSKEKRFVIPFVACSVVMFLIGATFAFTYVIPFVYRFFIEYGENADRLVQPDIINYYKGTTRILLAFGAVFEFPLLVAFLAKFELVTEKTLLQYWRYAMVGIFVLAALITPPEPISQMMMAGPMVILFFISVGVAWFINPASKQEAFLASLDEDDGEGEGAEPEAEVDAGASPDSDEDGP